MAVAAKRSLSVLNIGLDRDSFLRTLVRELAGTLEDVVGSDDAAGFVSVVGQTMGHQFNQQYLTALQTERLSRTQLAHVLVDLKARIQGDFYVIEQDDQKIVLGNRSCPFAEKVKGRSSLCMMTSNVFGSIAAENLGYARVALEQTIAQGHDSCRVVIYLEPTTAPPASGDREYYGGLEGKAE